ncbi:hypothetical protein BTO06_02180 [Tenacibaculum sp. SZ-18]|uniref:hypothetical protein n=1 Tax=Tenacibaculum sp. SZ-18 TaxID=754423 RepID=UPI000C2CE4FF|nr:hypothetical protein [Tenacibaculum sp. SZ-18]AUC14037.1 hypothetical protein BTO06_02180 [Tenacibaculum sp. SZ-18]
MYFAEIQKLNSYFFHHIIKISKPTDWIRTDLFYVKISINNNSWKILVEDEFNDFSSTNKLVNWFLILYNLEHYIKTNDILEWSKEITVAPEDFLEYYRNLDTISKQIEHQIGTIDAQISSYDYTLRTGVYKELLKR